MQHFMRYGAGIVLKPTSALVKGNAGHAALDHNFEYKVEYGEDAPLDEVLDAYSDEFDRLAEDADFGEESPDVHKDIGIHAVEFHMATVAPMIMPVATEIWLDVDFENAPYRLHQRGDVLDVEGRIIDHKFSGKKIDPASVEVDFQLSSYAFAYKCKYGEDPREVRLDRLVTTKKGVDYQPLPAKRTQKDYDRMLHVLAATADGILNRRYYPCDNTMTCGWCGYKAICWNRPWWRYLEEPEEARKEARKLLARHLAVGKVEGKAKEDDVDG